MLEAPTPKDDTSRLAALHALALLDSPREERFDGITRLAASLFDMPIALVSLVDTNRQWFKSRYGLDAEQTPRNVSFCGHAIDQSEPLVVHDAHLDERFADNPLVTGPPHVRFYAGAPVRAPGGEALGTLCLIDSKARQFSAADSAALQSLSRVVEHQIAQGPCSTTSPKSTAAALSPSSYEQLVQALDVGIVWVQANGRINFCNRRAHQLLALSSDPPDELPWTDLDAVDASGKPLAPSQMPCAAALAAGHSLPPRTIGIRQGNRDTCWVRLREEVIREGTEAIGVLCSLVDVSIEVETEKQRATHQERYRTLFEGSTKALIVSTAEGRVEAINPAACRLFSVLAQHAVGKLIRQFFPAVDNQGVDVLHSEDPTAMSSPRRMVARVSGDKTAQVEVAVSPIEGGERSVISVRALSDELSAEQLKHDFVSMVSHELRTPLTSIRGSLGLLLGGALGDLPERQRAMMEISLGSTERLIRLINDLLDIEKLQQPDGAVQLARYRLDELLQQSIENSSPYARQFDVRIDSQVESAPLWVNVDADRFEQVMANLLSNAVKFTQPGTCVQLVAKQCAFGARIEITDQGPGIDARLAPRLFQRFIQGDSSATRNRGGTGLGLSIAKAIVEQLHGTIGYQSHDGLGTTFWVELPRASAASDKPSTLSPKSSLPPLALTPRATAPGVPTHLPQILYVEDDEDLVSVITESLSGIADLTSAGTLASARELYATQPFDLVLLDLGLPDGDGRQLLAELSQSQVMVFSGRRASLPLGCQVTDWVVKTDVTQEQLKAKVRRALRRTLASNTRAES